MAMLSIDFGGVVCLAGGVAVVVLVAALAFTKRRRDQWQALARRLGLQFTPSDTLQLAQRLNYRLFRPGVRRRASNVMSGRYRGLTVCCFDYMYTTDGRAMPLSTGSAHGQCHLHTLVMVGSPVSLAELLIRPEGMLDAALAFVGVEDLDFESEEFSKAYHVTCADRKLAYDVLHPRAIELLLASDRLVIEGDEDALLFRRAREGRLSLSDELPELLDLACDFVDMLPAYLADN